MSESKVQQVYAAANMAEQEKAYDDWAANYEPELCAMGYRMPLMIAAVFTRFVPQGTAPILDAGGGGGIQAEPLVAIGYGPIVGIDLSKGMLEVAREKNLYADLQQATLGETLDFPDNHFGAVLSSGVITAGHAPANSFEELSRITRPGGRIIFSFREQPPMDPAYRTILDKLETEGIWQHEFATPDFYGMPYGEPEVVSSIQVYRVN
ncbi:MAG: class I SAM-dependent methyltransferase [Arenicella sp.]|nr:class I SAM-dependent methyltransferase [Arenicella sp.]